MGITESDGVPNYASSHSFFQQLWQAGLQEYDELAGIGWDWQSLDSSTVKAPFARAAVGPAPTDRGKQGTKRSILCDRRGLPLALVIEGANRHDMKLVPATISAMAIERPEPTSSLACRRKRWQCRLT
jgi:putative transposase